MHFFKKILLNLLTWLACECSVLVMESEERHLAKVLEKQIVKPVAACHMRGGKQMANWIETQNINNLIPWQDKNLSCQ